ncbi:MAG: D-alanyl-D-alanine carboxypeptidase family protein [Pseudomonadales bacterium]|nr:D-alanyl-D-alanine carboxypeptidase family protein [Pseudomonadales bacterium]
MRFPLGAAVAFTVVLVLASCDAVPAESPLVAQGDESQAEPPELHPVDSLFGHLAYEETAETLADAGRYRDTGRVVQLRAEAARAFRAMQQAARQAGVELVPISGFRTKSYQNGLFSRAIRKYGAEESAARWVAPPGYSEHHSGLALDIGALESPGTDVETTFEDTAAFAWLQDNAHRFDFEISFPRDNPQGVSYEPWHWRYTGLADSP